MKHEAPLKGTPIPAIAEPLRVEFLLETAARMESYLISFQEALWRGNTPSARQYWEAARACGRAVSATLAELDVEEKEARR